MSAVITVSGEQFRVAPGEEIVVNSQIGRPGETLDLGSPLLVVTKSGVEIGRPLVEGRTVKGKVISHDKGPKIQVLKFRRRKRYRRLTGHRQPRSRIRIEEIG